MSFRSITGHLPLASFIPSRFLPFSDSSRVARMTVSRARSVKPQATPNLIITQ